MAGGGWGRPAGGWSWPRGGRPTNPGLSAPQLHPMRMEQRMPPLILEVKRFPHSSLLACFWPPLVRGTAKAPKRLSRGFPAPVRATQIHWGGHGSTSAPSFCPRCQLGCVPPTPSVQATRAGAPVAI